MNKYGLRLKQLREQAGYSQEELAKLLNTSRSRIGMYEQGRRQPDFEMQEAIADLFNVSFDYLFGRSEQDILAEQLASLADDPAEIKDFLDFYEDYKHLDQKSRDAVWNLLKSLGSDSWSHYLLFCNTWIIQLHYPLPCSFPLLCYQIWCPINSSISETRVLYEDTIRPIAKALLDIENLEETDDLDTKALKALLKYKIARIEELEQQVEHLEAALDKEKLKYHEKLDKEREQSRRSIEFLKEQVSLKDKRMDLLLDAVFEKDLQHKEMLTKLLKCSKCPDENWSASVRILPGNKNV